jgi:hypothetical protein
LEKVTSLKLDEDLRKKAKIEAINRGMTMAEFIDIAIRNEIKRGGK